MVSFTFIFPIYSFLFNFNIRFNLVEESLLEHRNSNVLNQALVYYFKFVIIVSDKIEMYYEDGAEKWVKVPLLRTGIAWPADKNYKFRNPKMDNMNLEQSWCSSYFETFLPVDFHKFAFAFTSCVLSFMSSKY